MVHCSEMAKKKLAAVLTMVIVDFLTVVAVVGQGQLQQTGGS